MLNKFFAGNVNRTENVGELIKIIMQISTATIGVILVRDEKSCKYVTFDYVNINEKEEIFTPLALDIDDPFSKFRETFVLKIDCLDDIIYTTDLSDLNIETLYEPKNVVIIPIKILDDMLGAILLLNLTEEWNCEREGDLQPFIGVIQLILSKTLLHDEYKKHYQNKAHETNDIFFNVIGNKIRKPLNGIIGHTQNLLETKLNSKQKEITTALSECSTQLLSLINNIMDYSRLTTGNIHLNNENTTVKEIVEFIKLSISAKVKAKNQNLTFVIDEKIPDTIITDKQKLMQVIVDLVCNAVKFTEIGGDIKITFKLDTKYINILRISVKDNGIGISHENIDNIFHAFFQCKNNGDINEGAGLGLSIAKKLVTLMGGEISVKSNIGLGSIFSFTIKFSNLSEKAISRQNSSYMLRQNSIQSPSLTPSSPNRIILPPLSIIPKI